MTLDEEWLLRDKYNGEKTEGFFTDQKRLNASEPLGYVIGFVPFLDCKIFLDSHPLIPRPETEFWVEKAITEINKILQSIGVSADQGCAPRVLDLCAGSGCIGVSVLKQIPNAYVDFAEIDASHLSTITRNIEENIYPAVSVNKCCCVQSDLFLNIHRKYNYILTNPPYIDPVLDRTEKSVTEHEPHNALYGGVNGFEVIERILTEAPLYLAPGGQLWLEHEPEHTDLINSRASRNFFVTTNVDQYNKKRYSTLVLQ